MKSFWSEPYLWIHLAGLAVVPIALEIAWLGLATGDPILPVWIEFGGLALVAIAPLLAMQWFRPFNLFNLLLITLQSTVLTPDQRRILTLLKTRPIAWVSTAVGLLFAVLIWQLYQAAPLAAALTPLPPQMRLFGLIGAAVALLVAHLFIQVPVAVLQVLRVDEATFAATEPYPVDKIARDFLGSFWTVKRLVPPLKP